MTLFGLTNYHTPLSLSLSQEHGIEKQYLSLDADPTLAARYVHSTVSYMSCLLASILYTVLHMRYMLCICISAHLLFLVSHRIKFPSQCSFYSVKTYPKAAWSFHQNKLKHSKMIKLNKTQKHRISYYTSEALRSKNALFEGHKPSLGSPELQDLIQFTPTLSVFLSPIMETILTENTADCAHVQNKPF